VASYDAQINLLVSGQRELDRLTDRLRSIERQIIDINRLGVKPQQRDPATGRFGADPDRENRIRLARIQRIGKEEERRARLTSASLRTQNSELERSILLQSKLNSAVDLYERKLEELSRGGGGARLGEDLQAQIRDIRAAYQAATDGGTKNLSLVRSLATELGRVVERQNEINRLSSFQSKAFYDTQRFERRIAELRRAGVDASAFGGVGGQMRALRSAQARGNESEAKDATRRIKEALDRIARNLDETIREARTQQSAQKAARSWETFFEEASTTALLLKQNQKNTSAKFAQFFEDAANQALQISQNAKDTRKSWQFFFEDAQKEADRLRTERLSNFARLRGNPNQYSAEAGPLPASKSGSPRYFAEAKEIADQLLIAENEIAKIREQSLNESLRLESERLSLVDKRKAKEKQIKDVLLEAVSFGKGSQVKDIVNQVKTGGRNALVRGGLGLGALGAGGLYEGITGLGDVNLGVLNAIKGPVGAAASAIGDSINSALGGVPAIINSVLSGLGDIPGVLGLAAVAAYAFAPAMKTAGEAVYLAGQKFGETKFGKNIKLTLDRQTNIFESGINAASQMTMPIDASGFDKNLEIRQLAKDTSETWRVFFEDAAAFALQLKQNAKDTSKKWTEFFQDASYQALQIKENNKSTRKSWQVFFEDAASQTLLIKQQAKETAKSWQDFFENAANQALQIKQNAKATAQSWRSFFENAASEALRVSQEAKNTSNNWRQFFEDAAYQALQIKQNGKDTSESWRVFFEDAAYEAFSIKEKAKSTRSSWQQFFEDAELEAKRLREGKKTGLQSSLDKLQEARGARQAFLGGASPAEAIDKIVRQFGTKKDIGAGIGENITNTFASNLLSGGKQMASAATSAFAPVVAAIKKVFRIASPSGVMRDIAENLISSFIVELISNIPSVKAAIEKTFDVQRSIYEQSGRRLSGRSAFPVELDPGFLAAVSGSPLTPGRPSPAGAFSAATPRVGAPGSAFPFQTYNLAATQFPIDAAAQLGAPRNRGTDANRVLSEAIREYRAAVDNFWEGEDSQFEAIKKIVVSSTRLASAQLARRLQQTKDLTPDQQFQQIAREARSAIAAGGQSRFSRGVTAVGSIINGDRDLGVSRFLVNAEDQAKAVFQRMSDSILNSIEAFGFSVGNLFGDGLDRIRGLVPSAVSRGLSSISEAITDFGGIGGFGGFGGGGAGGGVPAGGGGAVNQTAQLLGFDAIADISRVSTRELEALSAAASELRAILDPTIEGFDRLDNQLRETIGNIDRQLQRRDPNADFLTRRVGPRGSRAISEGLIGGAFPLLFGQGIGASIGGLAGGAAGGFAGGNLGFGLSLIGTALGTAFDTAVQGAIELGDALQKPVQSFDKLAEKSFFSSRALEEQIKKTIDYGDVAGASAAIQEEAFKKLGIEGVNNLKNLGTESDRLNRAFAELGQQMQAVAAGPLAGITGFFADIFGQAAAAGRVRLLRSNLNPGQEQKFNQEIIQRLNQKGIQRGFFAGSTPSESEIGILQQQGALQDIVDKWQALVIKGKIKITEKDRLQSELNNFEKQLQAIDTGKGIIAQVRQAAQEQQDLDRQRADLVRSYEESFAEIRKKVEDEVAKKRFAVIEQENRLLDIRAANELSALQASNREFISRAGSPTGGRPEFVEAAQEAASIVAQFTEQQLSAEQEAAKIKRDAALEAKKFDFESVQFKANIEKEIARLNIETARKVADINLQVARKNQEYDDRRFRLEKAIVDLRLRLALDEIALLTKDPTIGEAFKQTARATYAELQTEILNIRNIEPPAKLREIKGVGVRGGVSTGTLDQLVANEADVIKQQTNALLEGIKIDSKESIDNFNREIQKLVESYSTPLTKKITDIMDEREQEYEYITRIGRGVSGLVAEKEKEIIAEGKLLKLRLEGLKASLEAGKYKTDEKGNRVLQAPAVVSQLNTQIQEVENQLLGLPDLINRQIADAAALVAPLPGLRVAQKLDEVQTSLQELATWESVGITAAESVGDAFGQAFKEISAGTASAQEILAGFFQNLANAFSDMASQMIAQMVQMLLYKQLLGPFLNSMAGNMFVPGPSGFTFPGLFGAADGAAFSNGIKPFAMGGVVSSPTLFKFANGGAMNTGVMGEAGPEAIMPLSRGSDGKLGVTASGSGSSTNNVTVNVDATGSKVQGDNNGANQLGRAVAAAVQEELLRQKRPGGLLS